MKKYKYLIITHTLSTGPSQELRDFFIRNEENFAFIEHPFYLNDREKKSKITYYCEGREEKEVYGIKIKGPEILYFIKDFFYTLYFVIKNGKKYEICFAADTLNAFSAVFLKKAGRIKKLVYWTIDYTPRRFKNKILNGIYHWMDRFICYRADLIWNSSTRMQEARRQNKVDIKKCASEIIVKDGCHFDGIERGEKKGNDRFKLVFMGNLFANKGVDFIISALPKIIQEFPLVSLTVIGTGPELKNLKLLTKKLNLRNKISFTGFIGNHADLENIIAGRGIALAPYVPDPSSYSFFSDVGKVKVYLASGIPVIITDVPEIARAINEKKAGFIFEYNKEDFQNKLSILLDNEKMFLDYRQNAIEFARKLDWKIIWKEALEKTLTKLQ